MRRRKARTLLTTFVVGAALGGPAALAASQAAAATPHAAGTRPDAHRVALRANVLPSATTDPLLNVAPSPDYWGPCLTNGSNSPTCIDAVVAAIDSARALEGVAPMVLPAGFASLSPEVQTFVVSNLERVDRGLQPAMGMVDALNTTSAEAAAADADPSLSSWSVGPFAANRWGSIWAGDLNALASDYDWMYNDGWGPSGSYNLDCTTATSSGCWGHRHNILSGYGDQELITGVGSAQQSQWLSIAQLFVAGTGAYPAFTHTWTEFAAAPAPAPTSTPGPQPTATPDPAASAPVAVPLAADATRAALTVPSTTVAGAAARVAGRVVDTTTGTGLAGIPVSICGRVTGSPTTSCTHGSTDSAGSFSLTAHPRLNTSYWLTFDGGLGHAAARSATRTVHVRPSVHLHGTRTGSRWRLNAAVIGAHAQALRLQRATPHGWVTVRRTTARSHLTFRSLPRGSYRVIVSATSTTAGVTVRHALR